MTKSVVGDKRGSLVNSFNVDFIGDCEITNLLTHYSLTNVTTPVVQAVPQLLNIGVLDCVTTSPGVNCK